MNSITGNVIGIVLFCLLPYTLFMVFVAIIGSKVRARYAQRLAHAQRAGKPLLDQFSKTLLLVELISGLTIVGSAVLLAISSSRPIVTFALVAVGIGVIIGLVTGTTFVARMLRATATKN
jgi:hypothetical protein